MSSVFDSSIHILTRYGDSNAASMGPSSLTPQSAFVCPRPTDDLMRDAKIVIIDDDLVEAKLVQSQLERVGFRRFETISDIALAHARIVDTAPDIVILDVHREGCSGWQVLKELRRDDRTQQIPVLVQTSAHDEETRVVAFNLGAIDFLAKPIVTSELIARVRNTLSAKIYRDRMTQYSLQLEFDLLTDSLTGIANRRAFDFELKRRIVDWNRQRIPLCLLLVDVDHFKMTNDRYGHQAGDAALVVVARMLKQSVRELDLVARFGGEEFAIILPYSTSKDGRYVAERARERIAETRIAAGLHEFQLTASFGIAEVRPDDDSEILIRRTDAALYRAKNQGRNRSYCHDGINCEPNFVDPLVNNVPLDSHNHFASSLESHVVKRTTELAEALREAIECLARVAEIRDHHAGKHARRVGKYAAIVAKELGIGSERTLWLEYAAQLHDIGKVGLPDSILVKLGPLSNQEYQTMQGHSQLGSRILLAGTSDDKGGDPQREAIARDKTKLDKPAKPTSLLMQMASIIAETHHERWDGTGYPRGLRGDEIPLEGRITAVADVFDALSTDRHYKKAVPLEQCFTILSENRGSHFDPTILDAFFRCKSEIIRTHAECYGVS